MTGSDNFLSRWSRRKQEVSKQTTSPASEKVETTEKAENTAARTQPDPVPANGDQSEPAFDLSKLPSLESIGPGTDIRAFLQPGVPASLSHAALRRAWSADPAIRDFIGLSENSWDFTAPETIPGFGPLLPSDNVRQMVADVFRSAAPEPDIKPQAESAPAEVPSPSDDAAPQQMSELPTEGAASDESAVPDMQPSEHDLKSVQRNMDNAALQQEIENDTREPLPLRRRHGGALPT